MDTWTAKLEVSGCLASSNGPLFTRLQRYSLKEDLAKDVLLLDFQPRQYPLAEMKRWLDLASRYGRKEVMMFVTVDVWGQFAKYKQASVSYQRIRQLHAYTMTILMT